MDSEEAQKMRTMSNALRFTRSRIWQIMAKLSLKGPVARVALYDELDAEADAITQALQDAESDPRLAHVHESIRQERSKHEHVKD